MNPKKTMSDPRESLADKLYEAGIDIDKAFIISLDAGRNLVDKEYLIDMKLKGDQLKIAENLVKDFYWGD